MRWSDIADALAARPSCSKLGGYWRFCDCRYHKGSQTCSEPAHIDNCPLPRHPLRNGRLNQMAYSLFLFMRDIADDDFVGWIDTQLNAVDPRSSDRLAALREAVIGPLRNVYGVADKVLAMVLSSLLLGAGKRRPLWHEVGATFVAVDTLVHNFLHRTGILARVCADHPYGDRCYRPGGCADILALVAAKIDAREFNPAFPATFPRFVQSAIWRYCAENGLDICNGNRIDDDARCDNGHCATGRTFVPFIRRDLYDKLVAASANGTNHPTTPRRTGLQARLGQRLAARRPICRGIGKRSALAISSSQIRIARRAGMRQSSSRQMATCSHCDGVTTRGNARLCAIDFGLACSIRMPTRQ